MIKTTTSFSPAHSTLSAISLALVALMLHSAAQAQALPQAGQVGREGQVFNPTRDGAPVQVAPLAPPVPINAVVAISVKVSAFKFVGNNSIRDQELQQVVADSVNQTLDLAGLDQVATKVSRYYRSKGYTVATAFLPPQQSADGSIQIGIIEGQYGSVLLKNSSSISTPLIQRIIATNLCQGVNPVDCKGSLIQDIELERAVLVIKDLPGISAVSSLKPGTVTGTSDLEMNIKDTRTSVYNIGFDNYGSKATGVARFNLSAEYNNPNGKGDQLTLGLSTTGKHSNTGSIGYSFPVGYSGGRMGLAFARGHYRLGASLENLLSHGTSNTGSIFGLYPITRTVNRSLYVRGSGEVRGLYSSVDSLNENIRGNASIIRVGVNGDNLDNFGGGGYTNYGLTASSGHIGIGSDPNNRDALAKTAGHFSKISYNIARQQALGGPVTLYAALMGQTADKNLDPSEQIGIAGPTAVRAYAGEGGGSIGAVANVELRYTSPVQVGQGNANLTYGLFVDRGWVDTYKITSLALPRSTRALTGYGLSATLQAPGYYLRAMLGAHRKTEPSAVDTDNRKFWLQGGVNF